MESGTTGLEVKTIAAHKASGSYTMENDGSGNIDQEEAVNDNLDIPAEGVGFYLVPNQAGEYKYANTYTSKFSEIAYNSTTTVRAYLSYAVSGTATFQIRRYGFIEVSEGGKNVIKTASVPMEFTTQNIKYPTESGVSVSQNEVTQEITVTNTGKKNTYKIWVENDTPSLGFELVSSTSLVQNISTQNIVSDRVSHASVPKKAAGDSSNYFLLGSFNNWTPSQNNYRLYKYCDDDHKFAIFNVTFSSNATFKVREGETSNWYPASDVSINAGTYDIYLNNSTGEVTYDGHKTNYYLVGSDSAENFTSEWSSNGGVTMTRYHADYAKKAKLVNIYLEEGVKFKVTDGGTGWYGWDDLGTYSSTYFEKTAVSSNANGISCELDLSSLNSNGTNWWVSNNAATIVQILDGASVLKSINLSYGDFSNNKANFSLQSQYFNSSYSMKILRVDKDTPSTVWNSSALSAIPSDLSKYYYFKADSASEGDGATSGMSCSSSNGSNIRCKVAGYYSITFSSINKINIEKTNPTFDITYHLNGGGGEEEDTYVYGTGLTLPDSNDISKEGHTFGGWFDNDEFDGEAVTSISTTDRGDKEFWAKWSINKYTVTWKNYNDDVLETDENVPYGTTPSFNSNEPTRPSVGNTDYTFDGWSATNGGSKLETLPQVQGDVTFYAHFTTATVYTITWKNYDDSDLGTSRVVAGDTPTYSGSTPTRDQDDQYIYSHDGWATSANGDKLDSLPAANASATYFAHYSTTVRTYTITWKNEAGTSTLETDSNVPYGDPPAYNGAAQTKTATAQYTYAFAGWSTQANGGGTTYAAGSLPTVSGAATYYAWFTSTVNKYTITWKNEAGTSTLETDSNVPYGDPPAYNGAAQTKTATAQYTYAFAGWSTQANGGGTTYAAGSLPTVSGAATYYAWFTSTVNKYSATSSVNGGHGSVSHSPTGQQYYETPITFTAVPDAGYHVLKWTKDGVDVVGNTSTSYVLTLVADVEVQVFFEINTYSASVAASSYGTTSITKTSGIVHGTTITLTATANYGYEFHHWEYNGSNVSSDATYEPTITEEKTYPYTAVFYVNYYVYDTTGGLGGTPRAYIYNSDSDKYSNWPGESMTVENADDKVYKISISTAKSYSYIIFNVGSDSCKSKDLTTSGNAGKIYKFVGHLTDSAWYDKLTVSFDKNGATGDNYSKIYWDWNGSGVLPAMNGRFTRASQYRFLGWNTDSAAESASIVDSGTLTFDIASKKTHAVTLYAIWDTPTFTVTWVNYDSTQLSVTNNVPYGTVLTNNSYTGDEPTKAQDAQYSYTFTGWSPAFEAITSNTTYTAQFSNAARTYTITLHDVDGTIVAGYPRTSYSDHVLVTSYEFGTGKALPTSAQISLSGYDFAQWYDNSSYTGSSVTAISNSATGNKEYWVKWTRTITLDGNGGTSSQATLTHVYNGSVTLNHNTYYATKTGYNFDSWYSADSEGTEITVINNQTSVTTIYAYWNAKSASLVFNFNGNQYSGYYTNPISEASITATYDSAMTSIADKLPTRNNYVFLGYYDAESGGTQYYTSAGESARNWNKDTEEATTLYAHWEVRAGFYLYGESFSKSSSGPFSDAWVIEKAVFADSHPVGNDNLASWTNVYFEKNTDSHTFKIYYISSNGNLTPKYSTVQGGTEYFVGNKGTYSNDLYYNENVSTGTVKVFSVYYKNDTDNHGDVYFAANVTIHFYKVIDGVAYQLAADRYFSRVQTFNLSPSDLATLTGFTYANDYWYTNSACTGEKVTSITMDQETPEEIDLYVNLSYVAYQAGKAIYIYFENHDTSDGNSWAASGATFTVKFTDPLGDDTAEVSMAKVADGYYKATIPDDASNYISMVFYRKNSDGSTPWDTSATIYKTSSTVNCISVSGNHRDNADGSWGHNVNIHPVVTINSNSASTDIIVNAGVHTVGDSVTLPDHQGYIALVYGDTLYAVPSANGDYYPVSSLDGNTHYAAGYELSGSGYDADGNLNLYTSYLLSGGYNFYLDIRDANTGNGANAWLEATVSLGNTTFFNTYDFQNQYRTFEVSKKLYKICVPEPGTPYWVSNGLSGGGNNQTVNFTINNDSKNGYLYVMSTTAGNNHGIQWCATKNITNVVTLHYGPSTSSLSTKQLTVGDFVYNNFIYELGDLIINNGDLVYIDIDGTVYGWSDYVTDKINVEDSGTAIGESGNNYIRVTDKSVYNIYVTHQNKISLAPLPLLGNGYYVVPSTGSSDVEGFGNATKMKTISGGARYENYAVAAGAYLYFRSYLNAVDTLYTDIDLTYLPANHTVTKYDSGVLKFGSQGNYIFEIQNSTVYIYKYDSDSSFFTLGGLNPESSASIKDQNTSLVLEVEFTLKNYGDMTISLKHNNAALLDYVGYGIEVRTTKVPGNQDVFETIHDESKWWTNGSLNSSNVTCVVSGAGDNLEHTYYAYIIFDYKNNTPIPSETRATTISGLSLVASQ